jgi:hypothetical protein
VQLRFAGVLERDEQIEVVRRMRGLHEGRVSDLQALVDADEFDDPFHRMTIEFALGWNQWACEWCARTERRLSRQKRNPPAPASEPSGRV